MNVDPALDVLSCAALCLAEDELVFTGKQLGAGAFGVVLEAWLTPREADVSTSNTQHVPALSSSASSPTLSSPSTAPAATPPPTPLPVLTPHVFSPGALPGATAASMGLPSMVTTRARRLVAVKLLRSDAPEEERQCLLMEARVMAALSTQPHPHIVQLMGVANTTRGMALVQEHCGLGNLLDYLRGGRTASAERASMYSLNVRLAFASQIASALSFLAEQGIVHRDVAARNVLLTNQMLCRLCDFGFSRAPAEEGVYQKTTSGRVPYKWMAVESLEVGIYSEKSDVWAYGVTLWELVTMGEK